MLYLILCRRCRRGDSPVRSRHSTSSRAAPRTSISYSIRSPAAARTSIPAAAQAPGPEHLADQMPMFERYACVVTRPQVKPRSLRRRSISPTTLSISRENSGDVSYAHDAPRCVFPSTAIRRHRSDELPECLRASGNRIREGVHTGSRDCRTWGRRGARDRITEALHLGIPRSAWPK